MTEQQTPREPSEQTLGQTSKLLGQLVEHQFGFRALSRDEAQWVINNTVIAVIICVTAIKAAYVEACKVLDFVCEVMIPANTSKFVAKEMFTVNTDADAPVKILDIDENFEAWFLSGDGKIEYPASEHELRVHRLRRFSRDARTSAELGGKDRARTTLADFYDLLTKQPHGEEGVLLNSASTNIFFIEDKSGALRTVVACNSKNSRSWRLSAHHLEDSSGWDGGARVFSGS